jgi:hypothetical protein
MRNRKTISGLTCQSRLGLAITTGLVAFSLGTVPAFAQVASMPKVMSGQTVWATGADGTTIKGKVIAIAATGLELKDGDRRTSLQLADIQRVETRDSLRNGAIIGAIPTAFLFGLGATAASVYDCTFSDVACNDGGSGGIVTAALVGAGIGALIGAGIDRAIPGRRVLYRSPGAAARLAIGPVASAHGAGVAASLRW